VEHHFAAIRRRFLVCVGLQLVTLSTLSFVAPLESLLGQAPSSKSKPESHAIENKVRQLLVEQFGSAAKHVTLKADLVQDLKAIDLDLIELQIACEATFEIEIPDTDWAGLHTVGDVVTYVTAHARRYRPETPATHSKPKTSTWLTVNPSDYKDKA